MAASRRKLKTATLGNHYEETKTEPQHLPYNRTPCDPTRAGRQVSGLLEMPFSFIHGGQPQSQVCGGESSVMLV